VRELLIAAAIDEFAAGGYSGTTVQRIAESAGLTVSAVYQHFDGKSDLFSQAVMRPFLSFLDEFSATWQRQRQEPWDELTLMKALMEELYDALTLQRNALVELAAARDHLDEGVFDEIRKLSTRMFLELRAIGEEEAATRGLFPAENVEISVRLAVAMVTAMAVFDVWLMPSFPRPLSREELIEYMARFALWGSTGPAHP
jgi:AcrR family transcriptional regulator